MSLTDEALAEIERWHYPCVGYRERDVRRIIADWRDYRQRLATVRALHPRGPGNLCPRCQVDWPCETAQAVGDG